MTGKIRLTLILILALALGTACIQASPGTTLPELATDNVIPGNCCQQGETLAAVDGSCAARQVLLAFFDRLAQEQYAEVAELYGGSYETLVAYNPGLDPDDAVALWQNGCQVNGFQCLTVRTATFNEKTATGEYIFTVEFDDRDGDLFVREACCGENPSTPPVFQFEFRVVQGGDSVLRVLDMPVYVP